jgi:multicomponent Na+:H+ antiporter subunit F
MTEIFYAAALALLLSIGVGLFCLFREPASVGAFLAIMLFGTTGVGMTLILSEAMELPAIKDVALTIALLTGILGVVLALRCWPENTGG